MRKLIAKFCMWVLGKLGYEKGYVKLNQVVISVDADEAIRTIKQFTKAADELNNKLKFTISKVDVLSAIERAERSIN